MRHPKLDYAIVKGLIGRKHGRIDGFPRLEDEGEKGIAAFSKTSLQPVWRIYEDERLWINPSLFSTITIRRLNSVISAFLSPVLTIHIRSGCSVKDRPVLIKDRWKLTGRPETVGRVFLVPSKETFLHKDGRVTGIGEVHGFPEYRHWNERLSFPGGRNSLTIGEWQFHSGLWFPSHRCKGKWLSTRCQVARTTENDELIICPRCEAEMTGELMETVKKFLTDGG